MRALFASRMHEWFGRSEPRRDLYAAGLADHFSALRAYARISRRRFK